MVLSKQKSAKITVTIPFELKSKLIELKNELNLSVSAIYKEALENYIRQKEMDAWKEGAEMASRDQEYISFVNEVSDDSGEIYDY